MESWDTFISHASEDKDAVVRPLANELQARGLRVWYDEFALRLGDSLRRSIEKGLANSRFGIVVLSPAFFAKEWPQRELDALVAREISGGKVILPVWHRVGKRDVLQASPLLADKMAVSTARGIRAIADQILQAVGPLAPRSEPPPEVLLPECERSQEFSATEPTQVTSRRTLTTLVPYIDRDGTDSRVLDRLRCDIEALPKGSQNLAMAPQVLIPLIPLSRTYFTHLQLVLIALAAQLVHTGCKVLFYVEDLCYEHARAGMAHRATWPDRIWAARDFVAVCRDILTWAFERDADKIQQITFVLQSQLPLSPAGGEHNRFDVIRRSLRFDAALLEHLGAMKALQVGELTFERVQDLVEEMAASTTCCNSTYIVLGPDRKDAFQYMFAEVEKIGIINPPSILVLRPIPDMNNSPNWRTIDHEGLWFPLRPDADVRLRASHPEFRTWANTVFPRGEQDRVEERRIDSLSGEYTRTLAAAVRPVSETLRQTLNGLVKDGVAKSISMFGRSAQYMTAILDHRGWVSWAVDSNGAQVEGDVDFLVIAPAKTSRVYKEVEAKLGLWGRVIFHPDMYSPRAKGQRVIEVVILPEGSRYLSGEAGRLFGCSLRPRGRLRHVAGRKVTEMVRLPDEPADARERWRIFKRGRYGLNDLLAILWARMGDGWWTIDVRRVVRFGLIDSAWVIGGQFLSSPVSAIDLLASRLPEWDDKPMRSLWKRVEGDDQSTPGQDVLISAYDCLSSLGRELSGTIAQ